jgi:hypothetical protein
MSFTEHEVGSVPSSTNPVTPTQPVAHKVWAIVGIIALSLTFWPIGLALGIILLFVSGRRYRTVGIVGISVGAVSMAITGMFYFLLLNVVPMALNSATSVAPIAPVATATTSVTDASASLSQRLKTADGLPAAQAVNAGSIDRIDTILAGFNADWQASCIGTNQQPDPRYLWGFVMDTKGPFYAQWGVQSPAVCGSFSLVNEPTVTSDPQAYAGVTSRWYMVKMSLTGTSQQGAELPVMIRLIDNHWMLVGLSPKGRSLASTETGQTATDNPADVIARMNALREQVFIQRSADLMTVYYNGNNASGNNTVLADEALLKAGIVPVITVDKITPGTPPGTVKFESTEIQGGNTVHYSVNYDFYPNSGPDNIPNVWASNPLS